MKSKSHILCPLCFLLLIFLALDQCFGQSVDQQLFSDPTSLQCNTTAIENSITLVNSKFAEAISKAEAAQRKLLSAMDAQGDSCADLKNLEQQALDALAEIQRTETELLGLIGSINTQIQACANPDPALVAWSLNFLQTKMQTLRNHAQNLAALQTVIKFASKCLEPAKQLEIELQNCLKLLRDNNICSQKAGWETARVCGEKMKAAQELINGSALLPTIRPINPGIGDGTSPLIKKLDEMMKKLKGLMPDLTRQMTACLSLLAEVPFSECGHKKIEMTFPLGLPKLEFGQSRDDWLDEVCKANPFPNNCADKPETYKACRPRLPGSPPPSGPPPVPCWSCMNPRPGFGGCISSGNLPIDPITRVPACLAPLPWASPSNGSGIDNNCGVLSDWWVMWVGFINQLNATNPAYTPIETANLGMRFRGPNGELMDGHGITIGCKASGDDKKKCCFHDQTDIVMPMRDAQCKNIWETLPGAKKQSAKPICWEQKAANGIKPTKEAIEQLQHYYCCGGYCLGPKSCLISLTPGLGNINYWNFPPMLREDAKSEKFLEFAAKFQQLTGIRISDVKISFDEQFITITALIPTCTCMVGTDVPPPLPNIR